MSVTVEDLQLLVSKCAIAAYENRDNDASILERSIHTKALLAIKQGGPAVSLATVAVSTMSINFKRHP